jgi:hypothetical protein
LQYDVFNITYGHFLHMVTFYIEMVTFYISTSFVFK